MRPLDLAGLLLAGAAFAAAAAEPVLRYEAPIVVETPAAFVRLTLPASAYARCLQPGLQDLRVLDADGERVPFALLVPRAGALQRRERSRAAAIYALPRRPAGTANWPLPVEMQVDGDRIALRRLPAAKGPAPASPGWLFDLGERVRDEAPPQSLRLAWSGPAEFSAGWRIELSDDLRAWRPGGSGQVMALASAAGPLQQPLVPLPAAARFVRLVWLDPATAPLLTGADAVVVDESRGAGDAPAAVEVGASPEPADPKQAPAPKGSLHFDLGGALPLRQLDLVLPAGTSVLPARVQARQRIGEPWHEIAATVFYRIERGAELSRSPPLPLSAAAHLRYLRIVVDERAAAPDAATTRLVVQAALASVVFARQGRVPYRLQAGSPDAPAGALPIDTLVPALDRERARFGSARLGDWRENEAALRAAEAAARRAAWRPALLWAVLGAGVALLALMVWRLARGAPKAPATSA